MVSSTPRPHFTPEKNPVLIVLEAGWPPGPVWTEENLAPTGFRSPDRPARTRSLYRLSYRAYNSVGTVLQIGRMVLLLLYRQTSLLHSDSTKCHYSGTGRYSNMAQRQTQFSVAIYLYSTLTAAANASSVQSCHTAWCNSSVKGAGRENTGLGM